MSRELVDFNKLPLDQQKRFKLCVGGFIGLIIIWIFVAFWTQYESCKQFDELNRKFEELSRKFDTNSYDMAKLFTSNQNWKDKKAVIIQSWDQYYNSDEPDIKNRIQSLINSREEREAKVRSIAEKEEELADMLRLQWDPFLVKIFTYFDDNIHELQKQGIRIEFTKNEMPELIQFNETKSGDVLLRKAIFPNGSYIAIVIHKATIIEGRLTGFLVVHFKDTNMPSGAFQLVFRKEMSMLSGVAGVEKETTQPPLFDPEFMDGTKKAIADLVDRVYDYDKKVNAQ